MKLRGASPNDLTVKTEKIIGDIKQAILDKKEEWLEYHMRKLLGDDLCNRARKEPAIISLVMKERGIWLKQDGDKMELMELDKVVSTFIIQWKK